MELPESKKRKFFQIMFDLKLLPSEFEIVFRSTTNSDFTEFIYKPNKKFAWEWANAKLVHRFIYKPGDGKETEDLQGIHEKDKEKIEAYALSHFELWLSYLQKELESEFENKILLELSEFGIGINPAKLFGEVNFNDERIFKLKIKNQFIEQIKAIDMNEEDFNFEYESQDMVFTIMRFKPKPDWNFMWVREQNNNNSLDYSPAKHENYRHPSIKGTNKEVINKILYEFDEWLTYLQPAWEKEQKKVKEEKEKIFKREITAVEKKIVWDFLSYIEDKFQIPKSSFNEPSPSELQSDKIRWKVSFADDISKHFWFRPYHEKLYFYYHPNKQPLPPGTNGYEDSSKNYEDKLRKHAEIWINKIRTDETVHNDWSSTWGQPKPNKDETIHTPKVEILDIDEKLTKEEIKNIRIFLREFDDLIQVSKMPTQEEKQISTILTDEANKKLNSKPKKRAFCKWLGKRGEELGMKYITDSKFRGETNETGVQLYDGVANNFEHILNMLRDLLK